MSRTDDTRPPAGLGAALDLVADEIPDPDVAEATWARGRTARRRRHAVAVGGMTSALVAVVMGWAAFSPQQGAPMLPARTPEGTTTDEARTLGDPDPGLAAIVTARAEALRDRLEADCPSVELAECTRLYRFGPQVDQVPVGGDVRTRTPSY